MAWNGSTPDASASSSLKASPKAAPSWLKGALAGLAVVAVGAIAVWFLASSRQQTPEKSSRTKKTLKEVTPALASKAVEAPAVKPKEEIKKLEDGRLMKYVDGKPAWTFARKPSTPVVVTNTSTAMMSSPESRIFKNRAEATIAVFLNTELGTSFVGDSSMYFSHDFKKAIDKALSEPVEILPDDPPDVVELKNAVEETKAELRKRRDKGEDISQILADTREELRTLGAYRDELEGQIKSILREGRGAYTKKDIDDLVSAANSMLRDRGATKEIALPKFLERRVLKWAADNSASKQKESK